MVRQLVMNPLWIEPPAWLAINPKASEESTQPAEDFIYHRPVLQKEALELLKPKAGVLILDGTCGGGGHTEALLESGADVLALDQDPDAVRHVTERLAHLGRRIIVRQANFRYADCVLDELGIRTIGGALLDLGVSSRQLENAERGFSLIRNGPLDMRMDPRTSLTAATIVNDYSEEELTRIFRELGEEPAARRIASMIVKIRKTSPFRETLPLARTIEKAGGPPRTTASGHSSVSSAAHGSERRAWRTGTRPARLNCATRAGRTHRGDHFPFAGGPDGEKLLSRS